jgi:beta-galactosidase
MIRRDRNHPSIVMWSIGNEILEQQNEDGWKEARRLAGFCHEEDPTRPVTAGFNELDGAIKIGVVSAGGLLRAAVNFKAPGLEAVRRTTITWSGKVEKAWRSYLTPSTS